MRTIFRLGRMILAVVLILIDGIPIAWDIVQHWIHRKEIP